MLTIHAIGRNFKGQLASVVYGLEERVSGLTHVSLGTVKQRELGSASGIRSPCMQWWVCGAEGDHTATAAIARSSAAQQVDKPHRLRAIRSSCKISGNTPVASEGFTNVSPFGEVVRCSARKRNKRQRELLLGSQMVARSVWLKVGSLASRPHPLERPAPVP